MTNNITAIMHRADFSLSQNGHLCLQKVLFDGYYAFHWPQLCSKWLLMPIESGIPLLILLYWPLPCSEWSPKNTEEQFHSYYAIWRNKISRRSWRNAFLINSFFYAFTSITCLLILKFENVCFENVTNL